MAVPDFQSMMLPLLEAIADGVEHSNSAVYDSVAKQMKVSAEDLQLMHSGGEQTVFYNRVAWGKTYLKKGGLIQSPKRGSIQITESGQKVLKTTPDKIDLRLLKKIGGADCLKPLRTKEVVLAAESISELSAETPDELIEAGYQSLRNELIEEILDQVKRCTTQFFERLVVKLLVAMGYGGSLEDAAQVLGRSGDGGKIGRAHV